MFGHAFGQRGNEHTLVFFGTNSNFLEHIVHLVNGRPDFHFGVYQTSRPYHLLDHFACMRFFVIGRCGRHKNALTHFGFKLFKFKRPVVQGAGQAKAIFHQRGFARAVAVVHGVELANHLMALVQEHQSIEGHVVGQSAGRGAWFSTRQMACVVFNAFAVPNFTQHFQVESGALLKALGFHQLAHAHQLFKPLGQLYFDGFNRRQNLVARRDVMAGRIDREARNFLTNAACERIEQLQAFNFIIEQFNAHRKFRMLCGKHIDGVAANTELAAAKVLVVALVLHANELRNHIALPHFVARAQSHDHAVVTLGLANAINGRDRGHNDHIAALHQTLGA